MKQVGKRIPPPEPPSAGSPSAEEITPIVDGMVQLANKRAQVVGKIVLADMIAQCDPKAPPPADLALWDVARPVGGEVI